MMPKVGEVWWVLNPGASTLYKAEIISITHKVVEISEVKPSTYCLSQAYKVGHLEFVEKIKDAT